MGNIESRLQNLERRAGEPERVEVRIFDTKGNELGWDGTPTGRRWEDFDHTGAIHVRPDLRTPRAEKWYILDHPELI